MIQKYYFSPRSSWQDLDRSIRRYKQQQGIKTGDTVDSDVMIVDQVKHVSKQSAARQPVAEKQRESLDKATMHNKGVYI